jgi:hypothetical protein
MILAFYKVFGRVDETNICLKSKIDNCFLQNNFVILRCKIYCKATPMKPLFTFFLLFFAISAAAQYKKAPDLYNVRQKVNKQILAGGYKGFDVVELTKTEDGAWDTVATNNFSYYANGLLKHELIAKAGKISKLEEGFVSMFFYDEGNNMVRMERNDLLPQNSYMGFLFRVGKLANYKRPEDSYGSVDTNVEQVNIDSILEAGFPEEIRPTDLEIYTYDKDGNLLRMYDSVRRTTAIYSYKYNANMEVENQREYSNVGSTGVWEYLYRYDKEGNLDSITIYRSGRDTSNVIRPENLEYISSRKYNKKHRLTEFIDLNFNGDYRSFTTTKNVYTYKYDTLIGSVVVLNANNDTTTLILNSYNKNGKPTLQFKYTYANGKRQLAQKETYEYDVANNIKTATYSKLGLNKGELTVYKQDRYFMRK